MDLDMSSVAGEESKGRPVFGDGGEINSGQRNMYLFLLDFISTGSKQPLKFL